MVTISDVEVFIVGELAEAKASPWASVSIIVKVTTSNGLVGYGEALPTLRAAQVAKAIEWIRRFLVGKDPLRINYLYREWYRHEYYISKSVESVSAYSAVDIALHDIVGKYYGMPIYQLLGGLVRDKIPAYANGWYTNCVRPEEYAERAREVVKLGYRALKFDPFGPYFDKLDARGIREAVERVRAVREAVGDDVEILIEFHGRFNVNSAIRAIRALEQFNPLFIEEPIHPELNLKGLRRIREATGARIAMGERIINAEEVLPLLENGLVDVLQPDIVNVLGFTGMVKVRALAEAYGVELAPHNAFGPVQHAATLQFDASTGNLLIQESFYEYWPNWKRALVKDPFRLENGHYTVPSRPGLGIEVDERLLEELRFTGQEPFGETEPVWVLSGTWRSYA